MPADNVFHPRMMELLSGHPGVAMRISGNLLSLRFPCLVPVDELPRCIELTEKVYDMIPSFVIEETAQF